MFEESYTTALSLMTSFIAASVPGKRLIVRCGTNQEMMSNGQNNRALTKRYTKQTGRRYGRRRLYEIYQTTERRENAGSSGRKGTQTSEVIQNNDLASNMAAGSALNRVGIWRPLSLRGTIRYPVKAKSVLDARENSKENEIDYENQHISAPVSKGSIDEQHNYAVKK